MAEQRPAKKGLILKPFRVVGSAPKARRGEDGGGLLELALPSGTRLRFQAGTDPGCLYLHSSNRPNTIDDSAWWLNSPRLNDLPRRGLRSDAPLASAVSTRPGGREPGPPGVGLGSPIPWTVHGASAPAGLRMEFETLKTGRAPAWTRRYTAVRDTRSRAAVSRTVSNSPGPPCTTNSTNLAPFCGNGATPWTPPPSAAPGISTPCHPG